jgi:uncharacterized membrane protein YgcG
LISCVTQERAYDNMVIQDLEIKHSEDIGYAREISITLVQVTVTAASVQTVPAEYLRSGKSMQTTGTASNSSVGPLTDGGYGGSTASGGSSSSGGSGSSGSSGGTLFGGGGSILYNADNATGGKISKGIGSIVGEIANAIS